MARATRADVAKKAGVSLATVSHVVNGRAEELGFATKTIERVQQAARELGYIPHAAARAFRYKSSKIIALFVAEIPASLHLPVFNELVLSIIDTATKGEHFVLPVMVPADVSDPMQIIEQTLREVEVAGAICEDVPHVRLAASLLEKAEVPTSWINPRGIVTADAPAGNFGIDESAGVAELLEQIDTSRVKSAIYLTGPGPDSRRLDPFKHLFPQMEVVLCDSWFTDDGQSKIDELISLGNVPDLIFGANDNLAIGALAALRQANIGSPEEVQVFGYGDFELASSPLIQLSSVTWPLARLGALAVESVLAKGQLPAENLKTSAQPRATTF